MSEMNTMDEVVADAVDDSVGDTTPDIESASDTSASDTQVASPGSVEQAEVIDPALETPAQDDFEKRWGIPAQSVTGRENRVPHSRVKTMVTKAEQDGYKRGLKESEGKATPQLVEFQTKVKDYEGRLEKVAQFEHVLENDPKTFLGLLSQIPAYKEFFDYIGQLAQNQPAAGQPAKVPDGMPQPDQTLTDGTKVYSMEGLQSLLQWQAENVEKRVTQKVQKQYEPIEKEWQNQQRMQQLVPVIEKQIAEARTWPNFAELEPQIVKLLNADQSISLERAYVKAYQEQVVPKMSADRNKMRTDILAELKQKPVSSSAPSGQVRPDTKPEANRTMDQIVADAVRDAGLM